MGNNGASGDGEGDGGGDDDDDDDDKGEAAAAVSLTGDEVSAAADGNASADADKKKKKRKRPKKKKNKAGSLEQTSPPTVPVHELFPSGEYPAGQFMEYAVPPPAAAADPPLDTTRRAKAGEIRHAGRPNVDDEAFLQSYRRAAEIHRQTRRWVQETVRPGHTLTEIATGIDDSVRALLGNPGLEPGAALRSGLGFPTGLSLNHCVAHYTPNPGHKDIVLRREDVMKVDFGVHINGWIVDSAFTMSFDPTYDNLLAAVKDATNSGIKVSDK
jgi:methionyl aminopeptidase